MTILLTKLALFVGKFRDDRNKFLCMGTEQK